MKLCFNDAIAAMSYGLDCVEEELLGMASFHGKRVALISLLMGKTLGYDEKTLLDLTACSVLHDNALAEYIKAEFLNGRNHVGNHKEMDVGVHCSKGEENVRGLLFYEGRENTILYHHENVDGTGPFGKIEDEVSEFAQIIHIADRVDAVFNFHNPTKERLREIQEYVVSMEGTYFSKWCVETFLACGLEDELGCFDEKIGEAFYKKLPEYYGEYCEEEIIAFSAVFSKIVDYKSRFTSNHSLGIATKARTLAEYYGFDREKAVKIYFAGALHDVGKLAVDKDLLEKPGKLSDDEFKKMKNHAYYTYLILSKIKGLEEIARWAALHHEKLNGKGYPFGYTADQLSFEERMMGCVDIYQALTEDRPYRVGMNHVEAMNILKQMAEDGYIDGKVVGDIETVFAPV